MRFLFVATLLTTFAMTAQSAEKTQPQGTNCQLSGPPELAGEEFNRPITLRIYPRARNITKSYTGCQVRWAPDGAAWSVVSITEIVNGDPVRIWVPKDESGLTICRYKNGRVVSGNAGTCTHPGFLLGKSVAPGCVKKLQDSVATKGLNADMPEGCEYE